MKPAKPWIKKGKVSSWFSDSDRDGVANIFDCQPNNPKKQGYIKKVPVHWANRTVAQEKERYHELRKVGYDSYTAQKISHWSRGPRERAIKEIKEGSPNLMKTKANFAHARELRRKAAVLFRQRHPEKAKEQKQASYLRHIPERLEAMKRYYKERKEQQQIKELETIDLNDEGQGPDIV